MRLLDLGSLLAALSIVEWVVLAALVVLFGKRALLVAMRILRWLTVAFAAVATVTALFVLVTVAFVLGTH